MILCATHIIFHCVCAGIGYTDMVKWILSSSNRRIVDHRRSDFSKLVPIHNRMKTILMTQGIFTAWAFTCVTTAKRPKHDRCRCQRLFGFLCRFHFDRWTRCIWYTHSMRRTRPRDVFESIIIIFFVRIQSPSQFFEIVFCMSAADCFLPAESTTTSYRM